MFAFTDTAVLSVVTADNSMTVSAPNWGTLVASTPIFFGDNPSAYGITPQPSLLSGKGTGPERRKHGIHLPNLDQVAPTPIESNVSIQGPVDTPGPIVHLASPANAAGLAYGMVKPVAQLGSPQLAANQLVKNTDGSLTLWFGPTLPDGAPASNWIPTPSTAYYDPFYAQTNPGNRAVKQCGRSLM